MNASLAHTGPPNMQPIVAAVFETARALSLQHGQRQFYTLAQVQSQSASCDVDRMMLPWIFAALVRRADFEAYFAFRDVSGTYQQLRTTLSAQQVHEATDGSSEVDPREALSSALDWLDLAADFSDLAADLDDFT
jgi:hypothetical protein